MKFLLVMPEEIDVESTTEQLDVAFLMGVPLRVAAEIVDKTRRIENERMRLEIGFNGVRVYRGEEVSKRINRG